AALAYERYLAMGEDDLGARLFLAAREIERGEDTARAIEHLEAAKACFPEYVGKDSPFLQLARLYRGAGDVERAIREYEGFAAIAAEHYDVRNDLKAYYKGRGDHERVAELCAQMIDISPFGADRSDPPDLDLHRDYAEALLALGRKEEAIRELGVQVELLGLLEEPARIEAGAVKTHVRLGNLHLEAGRPLDALEQAAAALRLAPDDADALMLKARAEEAAGYR
ncbi:MAG: tetratricopeptide repeat protein, partial [Planctomycetota bacterium]